MGGVKARGCIGTDNENNYRRQGHWELFHPNGQKSAEGSYVDGFQGGETGNTGILMDGREGLWMVWYENGQKLSEGTYRNGQPEGLVTSWYENGQKEREETYLNDTTRTSGTYWDENGSQINAD